MRKIPLPESQMQEVLFELIKRITIDRKTMMLACGVWNLTARISNLRQMNIDIVSNPITAINRYGREVTFVHYSLNHKKEAIEIYLKLKANQSKRPLNEKEPS